MRISDWSSDVCSSDLALARPRGAAQGRVAAAARLGGSRQHDLDDDGGHAAQGRDDGGYRRARAGRQLRLRADAVAPPRGRCQSALGVDLLAQRCDRQYRGGRRRRSEEHTSELPSLMRISYAVFCLKKKKQNKKLDVYTPHRTTD